MSTQSARGAMRQLWAVASRQHGVFTRLQAELAGLSNGAIAREIRRGAWVRLLPGVYRTAGAPAIPHQMLTAGYLWAGRGAAISHMTAARLHGLEGIRARHAPIEITVFASRRPRAPGFLVHRSRRLGEADRTEIDGIRVTTLARTLVDISPRLDEAHLGVAVDSGLARHGSADVRMLRRSLRRLGSRGRAGASLLGRVLAQRTPNDVRLDSALERRFANALPRAGLPRPVAHYDVVEGGRHVAEVDFAYPRERLAVQLNGAAVHRRYAVWERDQRQLSDLAAAGWRIVHVTWSQLESNEAEVMQRVARALGRGPP